MEGYTMRIDDTGNDTVLVRVQDGSGRTLEAEVSGVDGLETLALLSDEADEKHDPRWTAESLAAVAIVKNRHQRVERPPEESLESVVIQFADDIEEKRRRQRQKELAAKIVKVSDKADDLPLLVEEPLTGCKVHRDVVRSRGGKP